MGRVNFLFLAFFSTALMAADENRPGCIKTGFVEDPVCSVSLVAVLSRPSEYDGVYIRTRGYLSSGVPAVLFVSKEAHDASDAASSITVWGDQLRGIQLGGLSRAWVEVIGRFSAERSAAPDVFAPGVFHSGAISDAIRISNVESAWGTARIHVEPPSGYLTVPDQD